MNVVGLKGNTVLLFLTPPTTLLPLFTISPFISPPPLSLHFTSPSPLASSSFLDSFLCRTFTQPFYAAAPRPSSPRLSITTDPYIFPLSPSLKLPVGFTLTRTMSVYLQTLRDRWTEAETLTPENEKEERGRRGELREGKFENVKSEWQGKSYKLKGVATYRYELWDLFSKCTHTHTHLYLHNLHIHQSTRAVKKWSHWAAQGCPEDTQTHTHTHTHIHTHNHNTIPSLS